MELTSFRGSADDDVMRQYDEDELARGERSAMIIKFLFYPFDVVFVFLSDDECVYDLCGVGVLLCFVDCRDCVQFNNSNWIQGTCPLE